MKGSSIRPLQGVNHWASMNFYALSSAREGEGRHASHSHKNGDCVAIHNDKDEQVHLVQAMNHILDLPDYRVDLAVWARRLPLALVQIGKVSSTLRQ